MQTAIREVFFHVKTGAIGIEAIFPRIFLTYLPRIRERNIKPVLVFTGAPANIVLNRLIKKKMDECGVEWRDYSASKIKSVAFNRLLKYWGFGHYSNVGVPQYFGKNERYLERIYIDNKIKIAECVFSHFDYNALENDITLSFSDEENRSANDMLLVMGVCTPFVCIHPRDDLYHQVGTDGQRNIGLDTYASACAALHESKVASVKMGIQQATVCVDIPGLVNYAEKFRTDFMDVWLAANCKFFLGNTSGLYFLAYWFDTPVAIANYSSFIESTPFRKGDLYLPQKIWSIEQKRFLTFGEIARSDIGLFNWNIPRYVTNGLEPIKSSGEEVRALAMEMNEKIDGGDECYTKEDDALQLRFKSLFKPSHAPFYSPARVGRDFLRENVDLLK